MSDRPPPIDLLERTASLFQRHEHAELLAIIADAMDEREGPIPDAVELARARALFAMERYGAASRVLERLRFGRGVDAATRAGALATSAELALAMWDDVDDVVLLGRRAAAAGRDLGAAGHDAIARGLAASAVAFARTRTRGAAMSEIARARELVSVADAEEIPALADALATIALELDERTEARAIYDRALERPGAARMARLGRARIATMMGDFDRALHELAALEPIAASDLAPRRERVRVHLARRDHAAALAALDDLLAASPGSEAARHRKIQRAGVLRELGRHEEARRVCAELAAESVDDLPGKRARRELRVAATHAGGARRARLAGFGTVTQLRDHCGPACCELVLRWYGRPGAQVEIARAIKRENSGTPLYAMRDYLAAAGLCVRRVETELPLMRKLLDAGVPFIMSEEYSSTLHVAVAVGYDDAREVLEVQDPMTHELRETPYEALPRLLALANHGTIVAVPADDAERIAALDAMGAVETKYLALTDEAFRALDQDRLDDADRLADESIALRRDYEMSWIAKFSVARRRTADDPSRAREVEAILATMLELWPDAEWPRQYVGDAAYDAGRIEDALRAYEIARDRDDGDGRNWANIGDCLIDLGRRGEAVGALREAIRRMPWHVRATENLAGLLADQGRVGPASVLSTLALETAPENPFNHEVAARIALANGDAERALAASDKGLELDSSRSRAVLTRARALAKLGRGDEAAAAIAEVVKASPRDAGLGVAAAFALDEIGRSAEAAALAAEALAAHEGHLGLRAVRGSALAKSGHADEGIALLRQVVADAPDYVWGLGELGLALGRAGHHADAVRALAAAVAFADTPTTRRRLAEALLDAGSRDEAASQAHRVVERGTASEDDVRGAARVLVCTSGLDAARDLVRSASDAGLAPRSPALAGLVTTRAIEASSAGAPLTEAQRWVLAIGGILRQINAHHHDLLAGHARPSGDGAHILQRSWGIRRTSEARESLGWLRTEGHRARLARQSGIPEARLLAWDLMRLANVAAWAYGAYLVDADEAWAAMLDAAQSLQLVYGSFRELGEAYAVGRAIWSGAKPEDAFAHEPVKKAFDALLAPGGAWHDLAWDTPLAGAPVPHEPVHVIRVEPGEAVHAAITRALCKGIDPSRTAIRVELAPGTYPTRIEVQGALEIVAFGEGVVLQGPDDGSVVRVPSAEAGVRLSGVELRPGAAEGNGLDVVVVSRGLARLEKCTIRGGNRGVDLAGATSVAQLDGCTLDGLRAAVLVRKGHAEVARTTIENGRLLAVETEAEASLWMVDSILRDIAGVGVRSGGETDVLRTRIERTEKAATVVLEGATLRLGRCDVVEGRNMGVFVLPGAKHVHAIDCTFRGLASRGVQVQTVGEASFQRCRFEASEEYAVFLAPGTNTTFEECTMKDGKGAAVHVTTAGTPTPWSEAPRFDRCTIAGSAQGGLFVYGGGAVTLRDVTIRDCAYSAAEIMTEGRLRAARCAFGPVTYSALYVHDRGYAELYECAVGDCGSACVSVKTAGALKLFGCRVHDGPTGVLLVGESRFEAEGTEITGATETAGLVVAEGSRARLRGGRIHGNVEDALYVQEGAAAAFTGVRIEGASCHIIGAQARFERCALSGSDGAGIFARRGAYLAAIGCTVEDVHSAAIAIGEDSRGRIVEPAIRQSPEKGQSGVFALDRAEVVLRGGSSTGGSEPALEVATGAVVRVDGTDLVAGAGARTETRDEGRIEEGVTIEPTYEAEPEWQMLARLLEEPIAVDPGPAAAEESDEGDDEEGDDDDDEEGDEDEASDDAEVPEETEA